MKQGRSGLGLEAQKDIISHFVEYEKGELIADYCEVYTGKDLFGCTELRKAMDHCKREDAILIIAKSDRFRNTVEALKIYEEMGEGKIFFCDLPSTDKFTLTLFFALAEREALLVSIRTKAALKAKKARGESIGGSSDIWGKKTGTNREEVISKASVAASAARHKKSMVNPNNIAFEHFMEDWVEIHGKISRKTDWGALVNKLNSRGLKTATGMVFTELRARAMYNNLKISRYGR